MVVRAIGGNVEDEWVSTECFCESNGEWKKAGDEFLFLICHFFSLVLPGFYRKEEEEMGEN